MPHRLRGACVLNRTMEMDCAPLEWTGAPVVARPAKYGRMFKAAMNEFISTADALNGLCSSK
jgi:hypothetical protein